MALSRLSVVIPPVALRIHRGGRRLVTLWLLINIFWAAGKFIELSLGMRMAPLKAREKQDRRWQDIQLSQGALTLK